MFRNKRRFTLPVLYSAILVLFFYGYHYFLIWVNENLFYLGGRAIFLINLVPVIFGVMLGLFTLLSKSNIKFSVNLYNLLIQGIPAFIIGFPSFFHLIGVPPLAISTAKTSVSNLAGVWLGYVIISSLFSEGDERAKETKQLNRVLETIVILLASGVLVFFLMRTLLRIVTFFN
ncbi:MAG: hypothetical protein H0Z33_08780 [Bacillaceae bacterium]|nr:hypothetical protein [Bacillaceae bacterium]